MEGPTRADADLDPDALQSLARIESRLFGAAPAMVRVDRYELQEQLGAGGMGVVYAAWDPELRRRVAVKLVQIGGVGSAGATRLMREAQAIAAISHPNVIPVHDVGSYVPEVPATSSVTRSVFVVMELVLGRDLERWLEEGARPWEQTLEVFLAAGRGLAAAHHAGLLHRDFKPSNVLVGDDGRVRVVDFGLARPIVAEPTQGDAARDASGAESGRLASAIVDVHTRTGTVLGTPYYMAPELLRGGEASERSDQYAFAVALYTGLFGTGPYVRGTLEELTKAKRNAAIVPVSEDTKVPRWLVNVVLRGLAPAPEQRFASMHAMLQAIEQLRHRRRNLVRAGLGAAAVCGAIAVGLGLGRLPDPDPVAPPVVPEVAASPAPEPAGLAPPVLAFFPLVGAAGPGLDWAVHGLPHLMGEEVRDREGIRVLPYYRLNDQLADAAEGSWPAIARTAGATILISETMSRAELGRFELVVAARGVDGALLAERRVRSDEAGLADTARRLAREVVGEVSGRRLDGGADEARPISYERSLQLGVAALEQFDLDLARTHLDEARRLAPEAAEAHFYGAILAEWHPRNDVPEDEYQLASQGTLNAAKRAYIDGALLRMKAGHVGALGFFRDAATRFPDDIYLAYGLYETLYHSGLGDEAIAEFDRLHAMAPGFTIGLFHVMDRAAVKGDLARIEASIALAQHAKDDGLAQSWTGHLASMRGDLDGALRAFDALAEHDTGALSTAIGLDAVKGDLSLARARATQALERGDHDVPMADLSLCTVMGDATCRARALARERARQRAAARSDAAAIGWIEVLLHEALVDGAEFDGFLVATREAMGEQLSRDLRVALAMLFAADARDDLATIASGRTSEYAEVRHVAQALEAARAGDHDTAVEHWRGAMALGLDNRFQLAELHGLARSQHAKGDHAGVVSTCDAVIRPRVFSWTWAAVVGPCLLWSAEASEAAGDVAGARSRFAKLALLRSRAQREDPLLAAARAGLSRL